MTSANVIEYTIYHNGTKIGNFRKNIMCKYPDYAELLKYQPLKEYEIVAWGYDEDEDYWEDESQNLKIFLKKKTSYNKVLKDYFDGVKTSEQVLQEVKDKQNNMFQSFSDNLNKKTK